MTTAALYEVAVALPVVGTYTYRDPRADDGARPPLVPGTEVIVPFGARTVTGFVLGPGIARAGSSERASQGGGKGEAGGAATRDAVRAIEAVVGDGPAFDAEMIELCRFAADYYHAPLGEVMRAALPQGERTSSKRSVRLTPAGERVLVPDGGATGAATRPGQLTIPGEVEASGVPVSPILRMLAEAGGQMPLRSIVRRVGASASAAVARLESAGLVETGDELRGRRPRPTVSFLVCASATVGTSEAASPLPLRAGAKRVLLERVVAAGDAGIALRELSPGDRTRARALIAAGFAAIEKRPARDETSSDPGDGGASSGRSRAALEPTPGQAAALSALGEALDHGFATFLLHGVTGSGKTEVYLQTIARARAAGRGALVLVPEIALTPQLASRFRARFGDDVAVLHSALPRRERLEAWHRLRAGEVGIAVGARSAVFAPVQRLGVVVVDEEHDPSFKQEEGVRYNARDLAVVRAQRARAIAILGSATPSLETYRNADEGRFRRLVLADRATQRPLPDVEVIDLRRHPPGADGLFSAPLAEAVATTLAAGQQTILFLNRRGFSPLVLCRACGHVARCPQCAVSYTYHRGRDRLICHYCGGTTPVPVVCPACGSNRLDRLGVGTERVEALVRERFPDARVARLDRDTAGESQSGGTQTSGLTGTLAAMQAGEIDILIGTQMVTKGHDFGGVTLVGVLQPDQALHLPDFRAAERTFQLLEQVGGRAGRGDRSGRVLIQTYVPDHPAIVAARAHDYEGFVRGELKMRAELGYPPFARMAVLRIDGPDEDAIGKDAARAAEAARAAPTGGRVRLRGPAPAPIARIRGRSRYQLWLSARERAPLHVAASAAATVSRHRDVRMIVDIDPQSTL